MGGAVDTMAKKQPEDKREKEDFLRRLFNHARAYRVTPDIGIDSSLVKYSGLNSAAELQNSINQALNHIHSRIPDYLQTLGSALADLKHVPDAVGLGAVAVSIALELILRTLGEEEERKDSTLDMVRRVFAEEKASGVRDSMEEYIKCLRMYLHQPTRALEETERLERQLSEQLTRLKNSMLHDNQMSSRSMKHWTNGAAFHLQMLVHAARLKMHNITEDKTPLHIHHTSIKGVLDSYQSDLEDLLQKYKTYKKSTILIYHPGDVGIGLSMKCINPGDASREFLGYWVVRDKELKTETPDQFFLKHQSVKVSSDDYVDYMFDNWTQLKESIIYFRNLEDKLKDLIMQNDEFNIEKFLPVEYSQSN